jgi:hypothetical protein
MRKELFALICGVGFILWQTVSRNPFGAHDQVLPFPFFCRTTTLLFVLGRPLWREDGSVLCSAIYQWSESWRTHYCLTWEYWVPFPSPLTTRRDYGGSILTRIHTGNCWEMNLNCIENGKISKFWTFFKRFISNQNYFRFYKLICCDSIYDLKRLIQW